MQQRPVHEIKFGNVKGSIWKNETRHGPRHNTTIDVLFKTDDGQWKSTKSYGRDDLMNVVKVADHAHTWIHANQRGEPIDEEPVEVPEAPT